MLEFCEKLTLAPYLLDQTDVDSLRAQDFSDRDILSIVLAAAYRNHIIRVADALAVELDHGVEYAPELVRAFGVEVEQAKATLYADRLEPAAPSSGRTTEQVARRTDRGESRGPVPGEIRPPDQTSVGGIERTASHPSREVCWLTHTPSPDHAQEHVQLRQRLDQLTRPAPYDNLGRAFALRPDALDVTLDYLRLAGFGGSGLGSRVEGIIGLVVAATQWSPYPGVHHAHRLLHEGGSAEQTGSLVRDPGGSSLDAREREVARFCEQLTRSPSSMTRADIEGLRKVGFHDRDILSIAAHAALEDFVCRVAAGTGVRLETHGFATPALEAFQMTSASARG